MLSRIRSTENKTKELLMKLNDLKSSSYSAEGLFDDAQLTRNQILIGNIVLFIVISVLGYIAYLNITPFSFSVYLSSVKFNFFFACRFSRFFVITGKINSFSIWSHA